MQANRESAAAAIERLKAETARAFVGQEELVAHCVIALLAGGHILVEGAPGLGKTLLVRCLARAIGGEARRIQFTPDLMPGDITGNIVLDLATGAFVTRKGPVFCNVLVADEINRAPAKTQAALFEAMQEFQVSLDGVSHALPSPFMVMATENPCEHEGTYPLPDAQKDRFLLKLQVGYPTLAEETALLARVLDGKSGASLDLEAVGQVLSPREVLALRDLAARVRVDPVILDYAARLTAATRDRALFETGAGPRGSLALVRCARARALSEGRDFVIPDDIKALAVPALAHRVTLPAESELEGLDARQAIARVLARVEAPRA
ncbi:MAG: MoxR family ATPase [Treponema sp.]|jgi:MoxR-like ATPase|nr:MoxR family ATPase [Treponema sp.]